MYVTPPLPAVKVPLLVQFPLTVIKPEPWVIGPLPIIFPLIFTLVVFNVAIPPVVLQLPEIERLPASVVLGPAPEGKILIARCHGDRLAKRAYISNCRPIADTDCGPGRPSGTNRGRTQIICP